MAVKVFISYRINKDKTREDYREWSRSVTSRSRGSLES